MTFVVWEGFQVLTLILFFVSLILSRCPLSVPKEYHNNQISAGVGCTLKLESAFLLL